MKEIPLTRGQVALVDDEDYERLMAHRWHAMSVPGHWYARRNIRVTGKMVAILMHHEVTGIPRSVLVDHKNGDGLDNRRLNLRACTHRQNLHNSKPCGARRFKGTCLIRRSGKFSASICHDGVDVWLGAFPSEAEAAKAYDDKARELFGEFAKLNFPDE